MTPPTAAAARGLHAPSRLSLVHLDMTRHRSTNEAGEGSGGSGTGLRRGGRTPRLARRAGRNIAAHPRFGTWMGRTAPLAGPRLVWTPRRARPAVVAPKGSLFFGALEGTPAGLGQDAGMAVAGLFAAAILPVCSKFLFNRALRHMSVEAKYFATVLPRHCIDNVVESQEGAISDVRADPDVEPLAERLYAAGRAIITWERSWAKATVLPLQIVIIAFSG